MVLYVCNPGKGETHNAQQGKHTWQAEQESTSPATSAWAYMSSRSAPIKTLSLASVPALVGVFFHAPGERREPHSGNLNAHLTNQHNTQTHATKGHTLWQAETTHATSAARLSPRAATRRK